MYQEERSTVGNCKAGFCDPEQFQCLKGPKSCRNRLEIRSTVYNEGAEKGSVRTYLCVTVRTVSFVTLLPTSFAPVSRLDQTADKPGSDVNEKIA